MPLTGPASVLDAEFDDPFDEPLPENVDLVDLIDQPAWKTILLELVKKEKMDPWAIDVAELARKYLEKIKLLESANLRVPANALLASAILLRLKARTIRIKSVQEIEEEMDQIEALEKERLVLQTDVPPLAPVRMLRAGTVTLDELVSTIESILQTGRDKQQRSLLTDSEFVDFKVVASEDRIEERMAEILQKIHSRKDSQGLVLFSRLLDHAEPLHMIRTFVPILFLMNKGEIFAWQEEHWNEIFIKTLSQEERPSDAPSAVPAE